MAKGNVLLGQMRGKVGDVLFKHVDGQQITSAVNHPSNPKTERQQYQRAIMATVTRAYAAGSRIFDHSFEGLQTGAQNQAKFFRENCKILRNLMVEEVNAEPVEAIAHLSTRARCVLPGSITPVGFDGMMISDGTYGPGVFSFTPVPPPYYFDYQSSFSLPAPEEREFVYNYVRRLGIFAHDFYTFVGFINYDPNQDTHVPVETLETKFYTGHFFYIRFHVKEDFIHSWSRVEDSHYYDMFDVDEIYDETGLINIAHLLRNSLVTPLNLIMFLDNYLPFFSYGGAWWGCIHSHLNKKLRSRSYMYRAWGAERCGLTPNRVKEFWYNTPVTSINTPE